MIWDGHQPNSRGSNTQYKDSVRRVGMTILNKRSLDPRTFAHINIYDYEIYVHIFFFRTDGHYRDIELNKVFLTAEHFLVYVSVYELITYSNYLKLR